MTLSSKRKLEYLKDDISSKRKMTEFRNSIDVSKLIKTMLYINDDPGLNQDPNIKKLSEDLLEAIDIGEGLSFSELDDNDNPKLELEKAGIIEVDVNTCTIKPSDILTLYLDRIRRRWNLKTEVSVRTIIDAVIMEAMDQNPIKNDEADSLATYEEYEVEPTQVSNSLLLRGKIDYVACNRSEGDIGIIFIEI